MWARSRARSIAANAAGSPPKHRTAAFRRKYDRGVPWVFCGACANDERPQASPTGSASNRGVGRARRRSPKAKPQGEFPRRSPIKNQLNFISAQLKRPTPTKTENNAPGGNSRRCWSSGTAQDVRYFSAGYGYATTQDGTSRSESHGLRRLEVVRSAHSHCAIPSHPCRALG